MWRILTALCLALSCHAFVLSLEFSRDATAPPCPAGSKTIKISISSENAMPGAAPKISEPVVPAESLPQIDQAFASAHVVPQAASIPVPDKQKKANPQVVRPETRKKHINLPSLRTFSGRSEKKIIAAGESPFLPEEDKVPAQHMQPVRTSARPLSRRNSKPVYPELARRRGQEGTVIVSVLISGKGLVDQVSLYAGSGYPLLDRSALKAVKDWQFYPATEQGRPVPMEVRVPVHFLLNEQ